MNFTPEQIEILLDLVQGEIDRESNEGDFTTPLVDQLLIITSILTGDSE